MRYWRAVLIAAWVLGVADGQLTQVDLRTQSKSVDFSGANTTKPFKAGTVLPATCSVGEAFFQTNAAAGMNLYGCTALNSWTLLSGSAFNPALIPTHDTIHAGENYQASSNGTTAMTTLSPDKALTAYTAGQCFDFITDTSNPLSINIDGLGAQALTLGDGATTPPAGTVLSNYPFTACYDGTKFRLKTSSASIVGSERFDVKQAPYGARGDGSTDDTAAIQSVINAAYNAGGGTVYFPCGTYALATPVLTTGIYYYLWLQSGVTLQGENKACVTLLPTNYQGHTPVVTVVAGGPRVFQQAFQEVTGVNNNTFYPLNATTQGNNTVTLTISSQASNFAVGNYAEVLNVFAQTTLSTALPSVAAGTSGTMVLASIPAGFPTTYPFALLTDYNEIIEVTSLVSGTTYNVIRGPGGSDSLNPTPAHAIGATAEYVWSPAGVGIEELSTVTGSSTGAGVLTLNNPLARSFSHAIIANVTTSAGHDISISDLTMYCQQCFMVQNTFGFSAQRVRAITDGSGPAGFNAHFTNFNTNRGVLFKDCELLATASNMVASDDPAANNSQDIVFDNDTIVTGGFGSAEYPAHFLLTNSRLWLAPTSGANIALSFTGYDMKAIGNSIWVAPSSTSSMTAVNDSNGTTASSYQWFGNVVFTDNDISASGPVGSAAVLLRSTGAILSGGHINLNGSGMRAVTLQDFPGQSPSITINHVNMEGCTGGSCVFDNQTSSGYDGLTFTDNTLGGSSTDAIDLVDPASPNAGRGRITGNTSSPGSTFSTFLSWTSSNHPGVLTDDGLSGTLASLAGAQTLTNKTVDGVTPTVFGYVDATSSIQTQLNGKQSAASANSNNAGIGNCTSGQYETGNVSGTTPQCAQVALSQVTGVPTLPSGTVVGTSDTQTLTNKTVDGVTPTVFGYLDATSSIQTQLNSKQASAGANSNNAGIGNCTSGQYETGNVAGTSPQCAQVQFSQLSGSATLTQLPSTVMQLNSSTFQLVEEFVGGSAGTTTTIGTHGWESNSIGAAPTLAQATSTWNHPGIETITTTTTSTQGGYFFLGEGLNPTFGPLGANSAWASEWIAYIGSASNISLRIGFGSANQSSKIPSNGLYFRYDTSLSDAAVQACSSNSGTETCTSTGVTLSASTFADFFISSSSAGTISFAVNTSSPVTICASGCTATGTIATVPLTPVVSIVTLTSSAAVVGLDYFSYYAAGLTR